MQAPTEIPLPQSVYAASVLGKEQHRRSTLTTCTSTLIAISLWEGSNRTVNNWETAPTCTCSIKAKLVCFFSYWVPHCNMGYIGRVTRPRWRVTRILMQVLRFGRFGVSESWSVHKAIAEEEWVHTRTPKCPLRYLLCQKCPKRGSKDVYLRRDRNPSKAHSDVGIVHCYRYLYRCTQPHLSPRLKAFSAATCTWRVLCVAAEKVGKPGDEANMYAHMHVHLNHTWV